jgi:hypothetical protein
MIKTLALFAALSIVMRAAACPGCPAFRRRRSKHHHVNFRSTGKLPIRSLEFTCRRVDARSDKAQPGRCEEPNASFLPQTVYTVSYAIAGRTPGVVQVSVKSVMFSDGHTWKPSRRDACRVLK